LTDERLQIHYYVPAAHIRPIFAADLAPIHTDVPAEEKRVIISISQQRLTAFEGNQVVLQASISSGLPDDGEFESEKDVPTDTPIGSFRVVNKFPARHMGNGYITNDPEAYELPGVPWNMFFHESGYALHGTYWHNNFGTRMSHGCVNLRSEHAQWLFRWSEPRYQPGKWYTAGRGTLVQVVE
jgi:lipoprotein-anchoring transpeptidase ErfK/SrfK